MILNPPTDCIFQSAISTVIVDVYLESVSGMQAPLHGCWIIATNAMHLGDIGNKVNSAFQYVF